MPGNILEADIRLPRLDGKESTEEKFRVISDYLFLLLENLRYTLFNLNTDNFNPTEWNQFINGLEKELEEQVQEETKTIVTKTLITNELYSVYGAIADLTVDRLRTDYRRAQRYLKRDTSQLDYLEIHDEQIDLISATTDGTQTEQMQMYGLSFYWTDETKTQMTCTEVTPWPVIVYVYDELVKTSLRFIPDQTLWSIPTLVLGAGVGTGDRGKGFLQKDASSLNLWLVNTNNEQRGLFIGNEYVDIKGLRRTVAVDFSHLSEGYWTEMVEGDDTVYRHGFSQSGSSVTETAPDGVQTVVRF